MSEELYEFGAYRLNADRRLLSRLDGAGVAVTSRLFDTLLHLVRHAGELVSRRQLLDAVWGDTIVEENSLTQAISSLRQLLGERPDEHRYIVTVSGRGYRFIAPVVRLSGDATNDPPLPATAPIDTGGGALRAPPDQPRHSHRWWAVGSAVAALLGLALWALLRTVPTDSPIKTIAVLPFRPLVSGVTDPALEIGMADNLITRLSDSTKMVIRPLGSVRKFAGIETDPIAAGIEIGADAVLEGSVHRDGNVLRVTARLVRVRDGRAMWGDQFDQTWTQLFAVQDAIAERVVGALRLTLTDDNRARLTRHYTENEVAYRLYLLGRYHWLKLVPAEIDKSLSYFRQAIEQDPDYALAYAGTAEAYRALAITGDRRPAEVLPLGKAAALRAIAIDERLDSAWASLCFIQIWSDWNWAAAGQSCQRALRLNPNSADGHRAYAILLSNLARHDEAVAHARRASELDPLSLITTAIEGHVLHYAGRNIDALRRLRATLELERNFWIAHLFAGKAEFALGRYAEALAEFARARDQSAGNSEAVSLIGYTEARRGNRAAALQSLKELRDRSATSYVPPFNVAMIYHGLGDEEQTFAWLEKAYADRDVRLTFLKVEKKWDSIRSDPRFRSLAERMALN